ncbi:MAG: alpha/beta hydrolase [Rhodospirillaceae bacterium]
MTDPTYTRPPHRSLELGAATIAFHQLAGIGPGVVFCGGFRSDMTGGKALALESWARAGKRAFIRFDYQGHGASSGRFEDGTIGKWTGDAVAVLDRLTTGQQILVGSSMGAWIMLLVALARPERVAGLVAIAAAPDFTEDLVWGTLSAEQRLTLLDTGALQIPSEYTSGSATITNDLINEARRHLLLRDPIDLHCPVRLLHGMNDPDVPWQTSTRLANCLKSADVRLTLIKDGDHRLSRDQDIALLLRTVDEMVAACG